MLTCFFFFFYKTCIDGLKYNLKMIFLEHNGETSVFTSVNRTCFVHDVTSVINGAT